jgi:hypothetical protein
MRAVLRDIHIPEWIDQKSVELLESARSSARESGLFTSDVLANKTGVHWFPWAGTSGLRVLKAWADYSGVKVQTDSISIYYLHSTRAEFNRHISLLQRADRVALARLLPNKIQQKFDRYIDSDLLDKANGADRMDFGSALNSVRCALTPEPLTAKVSARIVVGHPTIINFTAPPPPVDNCR